MVGSLGTTISVRAIGGPPFGNKSDSRLPAEGSKHPKMMDHRNPLLILGATCLALTSFAGNSLLCRLALSPQSIDAASFTAARLVTGGIVLLLITLVRWRPLGRFGWGGSWRAALALFCYAAAFSYAYNGLSAGTGALLLFGSVQVSMIAWGMSRGVRPSIAEWIAILTASTGLVVLVLPGLTAPPWTSAALMVLAGAAWGAYSLLGRGSPDPIAATTGNFVRAAVFALPLVAVPLSAHLGKSPVRGDLACIPPRLDARHGLRRTHFGHRICDLVLRVTRAGIHSCRSSPVGSARTDRGRRRGVAG
jgi:drug/metabolite transporter (DMT)-like permease